MREGVRQGPDALAWEQIDVFLPWGFRLAEIAIEVHVFHGEQDAWVARGHVDFLVETLPSARLTPSGRMRGTARDATGARSFRRSRPDRTLGRRTRADVRRVQGR